MIDQSRGDVAFIAGRITFSSHPCPIDGTPGQGVSCPITSPTFRFQRGALVNRMLRFDFAEMKAENTVLARLAEKCLQSRYVQSLNRCLANRMTCVREERCRGSWGRSGEGERGSRMWIHGNLRRLDYSNCEYGCVSTDILLGLTLRFSQRNHTCPFSR